MQHCK